MQGLNLAQPGLKYDTQWFRKAVFYEVLVRAFSDSKGSGAGDVTALAPLVVEALRARTGGEIR